MIGITLMSEKTNVLFFFLFLPSQAIFVFGGEFSDGKSATPTILADPTLLDTGASVFCTV